MLPLELTLVLAATRDMGIGLNGTLPWTGLKKEMAYFARVTKRVPPSSPPPSQQQQPALNAVIMGRKTWDSIPARFRPLRGRLNIVISRSAPLLLFPSATAVENAETNVVVMAPSLEQALAYLQQQHTSSSPSHSRNSSSETTLGKIGRVFIIGGAQMYDAALALRETRRILLTRVLTDFACDTFFPLAALQQNVSNGDDGEKKKKMAGVEEEMQEVEREGGEWKRRGQAALDAWAGEAVPAGVQEENGTRYEFQMWERD
ncbi:dihydrofolate reductase-like domain-containing protein [Lasiosphaeria miniovina]|uniref:Dihydrofolate reductase n=1 Tax=Lasiosphaeria miniovina TaxID=1954250 RepID=A0AA40A4I6_9PEZI|nr:dihydrofolate reductase-like domain-containing protein [Lasiosphaeria miniovina]KAK0709137.1 dihydrofolate reductase-like domain-containing protein [Lasiosphaeria miniovina]